MPIVVFGVNHKTAPIEIREKFFLTPTQQDLLLSELKSNPSIAEAFVLSTCNRTEVYLHTINPDSMDASLCAIVRLLTNIKKIGLTLPDFREYFYCYEEQKAVCHLLEVACGLDSLILGEKQILGQVKTAIERARKMTMFSRSFNILFNLALRTAKKAQSETSISFGGSSVSWAAVTMAENLLGTLAGKSLLIIGAGKMGELTLSQIRNKGLKNIYLMNRTGSAAEALAQKFCGIPVSFFEVKETLSAVDVCICSAGAPHYILDKAAMEKVMSLRQNRKLILLDISMPRNIDPQVAEVKDVFLSHIDDLDKVVGESMRKRQAAVPVVEAIIDEKLNAFYDKILRLKRGDAAGRDFSESIEV